MGYPKDLVINKSWYFCNFESMKTLLTVFVLLNAQCAEVMIGCAFINRRAIGGVGRPLGPCALLPIRSCDSGERGVRV